MKDDKGIYYYPFPENKRTRMYVKEEGGTVFFRLWSADDALMWEKHGWVPYDAVVQAMSMYQGKGFDPKRAYDMDTAYLLLSENRRTR